MDGCADCGREVRLDSNGCCKRCNEAKGLRQCVKCGDLLPALVSFYKEKRRCKPCMSQKTGAKLGRPLALDGDKLATAVRLYEGGLSIEQIANRFGDVSRGAVQRGLVRAGAQMRGADCRRHALNETFFDNIQTEEQAYWLGFLAADGNVYGTRIQVNLGGKDFDHLQKFAQAAGYDGAIRHTKKNDRKTGVTYNGASLAFRSLHMVRALATLHVVPNKSLTAEPWVGPERLMRHYWRGAVDGDGWNFLRKRGGPELGLCGSSSMVAAFAAFAYAQGCATKSPRPAGNIWAVHYLGDDYRRLHATLYNGATVAMDRKATALA